MVDFARMEDECPIKQEKPFDMSEIEDSIGNDLVTVQGDFNPGAAIKEEIKTEPFYVQGFATKNRIKIETLSDGANEEKCESDVLLNNSSTICAVYIKQELEDELNEVINQDQANEIKFNQIHPGEIIKTENCDGYELPSENNVLTLKTEYCKSEIADVPDTSTQSVNGTNSTKKLQIKSNGGYFECNICLQRTRFKRALARHMKMHTSSLYSCKVCDFTTKHRSSLSVHKKRHDDNALLFVCDKCNFKTKIKWHLRHHKSIKHDLDAVLHGCNKCGFKTNHKNNLCTHKKLKHATITATFACDECEYVSNRKTNLWTHIRMKHDANAVLFKCDSCSYTSKSKSNLTRHKNMLHGGNGGTYKCDTCEFTSNNKSHFERHRRTKQHQTLFVCDECNYVTKHQWNFIKHNEAHITNTVLVPAYTLQIG